MSHVYKGKYVAKYFFPLIAIIAVTAAAAAASASTAATADVVRVIGVVVVVVVVVSFDLFPQRTLYTSFFSLSCSRRFVFSFVFAAISMGTS